MDKKRKRDSVPSTPPPILVYSAPGHSRFAKLFTETSLEEIKEIVRKRLELSSVSDFLLFYDIDIALVNDDDFDAFAVHARSAGSSVHVAVKVLSQGRASSTNASGPSGVAQNADPVTVDGGAGGNSPPRKKRKVAPVALDPTASISSAPSQKKRKATATLVEDETAPEVVTSTVPQAPDEGQGRKKKRKEKATAKDSDSAQPVTVSTTVPGGTSDANHMQDPPAGAERPKKKSKKAPGNDTATAPKSVASANALANEVQVDAEKQRKAKSKKAPEQGPDTAPPKSSVSKKSTKKLNKDPRIEDAPSVDDQPSKDISALAGKKSEPEQPQKTQSIVDSSSIAKARKPSKGKKKIIEQSLEDVESPDRIEPEQAGADPASYLENWCQEKLPVRPTAALESDLATDKGVNPTAKGTRKSASSKDQKQASTTFNAATPCPVCQTSPFHLRYRCPVVQAGSGSIRKRIAELQQDDTVDHSQLIQELCNMAEKSHRKTKDSQNVNAHSPILLPDAQKGGVSNPFEDVVGHEVAAAVASRRTANGSSSSSDDSESEPSITRKVAAPRPASSSVDAELDAIIRGPGGPSQLTLDDIVFDEEQDEEAESVVLENDDDEDLEFRRRSRKLAVVASSDEEDDENDDEDSQAGTIADGKHPPVVNISVRADSRRSSTRSATEPFMAIHTQQSVDIDPTGDQAVEDAMASDNAIFHPETPAFTEVGENLGNPLDPPIQSTRTTPIPPTPTGSPGRHKKASANVLRFRTPEITAAYDPIQPAEDFPPTPVQQNKAAPPGTPSTPRMVQRMKDRTGKIPVRLSQLDPPFTLNPQTRTTPPQTAQNDVIGQGRVDEDTGSQRTRTRSSTRLSSVAPPPPASSSEVPQPAKRRRAPNKTPEQKAQELAAKAAAKEEREKSRKEKAEAKAAGKKGAAKKAADLPVDDLSKAVSPSQPLPEPASVEEPSEPRTPMPPPLTPRTPMSQDEWTVLKSTSPQEETQDLSSMRDELRSSSPESPNHGDGEEEEAPLFLPAESQVPFPYSQWNSIPEDFCPGSPKNSGDEEEEEEEVAASMKSSQRPGSLSYRRLTDIASQPSLFSMPTLRTAALLPATFPRAKDKRDELYGAAPKEDDDSTDSDSSAGDAPSHIPESRRAGMATR
ncbi:hypothetical protein FB451DRAFT_1211446 [Mycena latifolia]|nr:hypothetical protein FB451DRAFT_1211446 [Mycena latifolia]